MTVPHAAIQEIFSLFEGQLDNVDEDGGVQVGFYLDEYDVERTKQTLAQISAWLDTIPTKKRYPGLADDDEEDAQETSLSQPAA
jgi:hypothetical protein